MAWGPLPTNKGDNDKYRPPAAKRLPEDIRQLKKLRRYNPEKEKERRLSSSKRGYDARWQKFSKSYLMDHPLCARCEVRSCAACAQPMAEQGVGSMRCTRCGGLKVEEPRVESARLTHHIIPLAKGGAHCDEGNSEALCVRCHGKETRYE